MSADPSKMIYSAKYSGVEVYEFLHPTGSIMKRKSDDWVNVTHILKAAHFPKAKRTRILERDVIKEMHEKVQGGFGKYQGTWVPLDIARKLATKFGVLDDLSSLFDFKVLEGEEAPPPAPKHHHSSRNDSKRATKSASTSSLIEKPRRGRPPGSGASRLNSNDPESNMGTVMNSTSLAVNTGITRRGRGRPPNSTKRKLGVPLKRSQSDVLNLPQDSLSHESSNGRNVNMDLKTSTQENTTLEIFSQGKANNDGFVGHTVDLNPHKKMKFKEIDIRDGLSSDIEPDRHRRHNRFQDSNEVISPNQLASLMQGQNNEAESLSSSLPTLPSSPSDLSESNPFSPEFETAPTGTSPVRSGIPRYTAQSGSPSSDAEHLVNQYLSKLVDYFISNEMSSNKKVPDDLLNPPSNSIPYIDTPLDPEYHTAFHWACSMGNLPIIEALYKAGASIRATNSQGQTPLMRSSMFHNSYTRRSFPKILQFLHETVMDCDTNLQTVLHHIIRRKSSTPSAVYYLDVVLSKIKEFFPSYRIQQFLNARDKNGDTALHIAARTGDKTLFDLLVQNGALSTIANNEGVTPNELISEKYEQMILEFNESNFKASNLGPTNNETNFSHPDTKKSLAKKTDPYEELKPGTDYEIYSSQVATNLSRGIPQLSQSLKKLSQTYNDLFKKREGHLESVQKNLKSLKSSRAAVDGRIMQLIKAVTHEEIPDRLAQQEAKAIDLLNDVQSMEKLLKTRVINYQRIGIQQLTETNMQALSLTSQEDLGDTLDNRLSLSFQLVKLQFKRKVQTELILSKCKDKEKLNKYRRIISEGTEMNSGEVDECLDIILDTLMKSN